ncbi:hypothetical protein BOH66_09910 [Microbacterium aurum]|uniref:Uncharacterized protein n=1 Tax=Microbacterium aurum TaxID=36805 RepID=A0A1P8U8X7_9MICO|nr:hypothetical protein BOH66_09910 [Microbacterium aurum]
MMIDLNSTDHDGETVALLEDVSGGTLSRGRMALAYEPEAGLCAQARVASIREDLGIAYLQVDWRSMKRMGDESGGFQITKHDWVMSASASASVGRDVHVRSSGRLAGRMALGGAANAGGA